MKDNIGKTDLTKELSKKEIEGISLCVNTKRKRQ